MPTRKKVHEYTFLKRNRLQNFVALLQMEQLKKIILINSALIWWVLWVIQWLTGLTVVCTVFWSGSWFLFLFSAVLCWLSYVGRVYLKHLNRQEFERYYNVDKEIAPHLSGRERRRLRRKNQRDTELNDIKDGIL